MELLVIPLVLVGVVFVAGFATVLVGGGAKAFQWSCFAVGCGSFVTAAVLSARHEDPDPSFLAPWSQQVVLTPGTAVTAHFEVRKRAAYHLLIRPGTEAGERVAEAFGYRFLQRTKVEGVDAPWQASRNGEAAATEPGYVKITSDSRREPSCVVLDLGFFRAPTPGAYELTLRIEAVPPVLLGERVELAVDAAQEHYKTLWVRASLDALIRSIFVEGGIVAFSLGLSLACLRPCRSAATRASARAVPSG